MTLPSAGDTTPRAGRLIGSLKNRKSGKERMKRQVPIMKKSGRRFLMKIEETSDMTENNGSRYSHLGMPLATVL